jgi:hypothetical protein
VNDHDDHDFCDWMIWAPTEIGGWAGLVVFLLWVAFGYWLYCT